MSAMSNLITLGLIVGAGAAAAVAISKAKLAAGGGEAKFKAAKRAKLCSAHD